VGSALQGAIGFGLSLLGAPLLAILEPSLVPGPLLAAALFLSILMAFREHRAIDFHGVGWALVGRVPGTFVGALIVAAIPRRETTLLVGTMVLVAVLLVAFGPRVARTRSALFGAGVFSGILSTTSSIGAPPVALLYQDSQGDRVRGTLTGFFLVGIVISLASLAIVGRFGRVEMLSSLFLSPAVVAGFLLSSRVAAFLDRGYTRTVILATSGLAGLAILIEAAVSRT
jgi:uncharacterized membrane protein YfcA